MIDGLSVRTLGGLDGRSLLGGRDGFCVRLLFPLSAEDGEVEEMLDIFWISVLAPIVGAVVGALEGAAVGANAAKVGSCVG